MARPLFIGSEIYRRSTYGKKHPLAIPRVSTTIDLCRAMGWLEDEAYVDSPMASPEQLARFHDPAYIEAIMDAERDQALDEERRQRFNIGKLENPIFAEVYRRPATASGGSILAARMLAATPGIVYTPAGGTHHGRTDRASGFCYFNDPVLAILTLLDSGVSPILYLDVDAHHGDGVQDAFADDARVLTISVHEAGRWPHTGASDDRAGGAARNLPVPPGFNDSEMGFLMSEAIAPLAHGWAPEAVVLQCGADGLADDPLSRLSLSNRALWAVAGEAMAWAPRVLVMGGGGYNPWSVGRCWSGIWATLNGIDPQQPLSDAATRGAAALDLVPLRRPQSAGTLVHDHCRPGDARADPCGGSRGGASGACRAALILE